MSRLRDPDCPVPGEPCLLACDDFIAEMARLRAREELRAMVPCRACGERNRLALRGHPRCYACRVRAEEGDHPRGSGSGPAVLPGSANLNRIAMEGERMLPAILPDDLCQPCRVGFPLRLGIQLGRLDVDL